jgi:hypothetical protein
MVHVRIEDRVTGFGNAPLLEPMLRASLERTVEQLTRVLEP